MHIWTEHTELDTRPHGSGYCQQAVTEAALRDFKSNAWHELQDTQRRNKRKDTSGNRHTRCQAAPSKPNALTNCARGDFSTHAMTESAPSARRGIGTHRLHTTTAHAGRSTGRVPAAMGSHLEKLLPCPQWLARRSPSATNLLGIDCLCHAMPAANTRTHDARH